MSNVVALVRSRAEPHSAVGEFYLARQQMLRTLSGWMNTHPPTDEVRIEIDGTVTSIRCLLATMVSTTDA